MSLLTSDTRYRQRLECPINLGSELDHLVQCTSSQSDTTLSHGREQSCEDDKIGTLKGLPHSPNHGRYHAGKQRDHLTRIGFLDCFTASAGEPDRAQPNLNADVPLSAGRQQRRVSLSDHVASWNSLSPDSTTFLHPHRCAARE